MRGHDHSAETDDRGQAYTLEGIIGAMVLLTAVLMALNSGVILPSTTGTIDRGVQSDVGQQGADVLRIAAEDGNLSATLRCWDTGNTTFYGAPTGVPYNTTHPMDNSLGTMLNRTFTERFNTYGLEASYRTNRTRNNESRVGSREITIVGAGGSIGKSITVSQTVTLYENQTLTSSCSNDGEPDPGRTLRDAHENGNYPIPPATPPEHRVYNVVEVRLTIIW